MTTSNLNRDPAATSQTPLAPPAPPAPPGAVKMDHVALYLPSVLGYEKIARRVAEAVAEQMDFKLDRIEDLKTAVAEACMNAIEHVNASEREANVAVHMTILPDKLEVRVADVGRQLVPDELPVPGSGDMRGWGFFFIQNLVDEMEIVKLPDGGNEVRMVLYLQPQPDATAKDQPDAPSKVAASADTPAAAKDAAIAAPDKTATEDTPAATARAKAPDTAPPAQALAPVQEPPRAVQPVETKPAAVEPVKDQPHAVQLVTDPPKAIQPASATATNAAAASTDGAAPPEQKPSAAPDDETSPES